VVLDDEGEKSSKQFRLNIKKMGFQNNLIEKRYQKYNSTS